jgi:hypothetical protein
MDKKSTLGQISVSQGGFGSVFPGQFPVGAQATGRCPSGYLPAPSAIVPNQFTCVRAPGSYVMGRRR